MVTICVIRSHIVTLLANSHMKRGCLLVSIPHIALARLYGGVLHGNRKMSKVWVSFFFF